MNLVDVLVTVVLGKIVTDLFGKKNGAPQAQPRPEPPRPQPPGGTSPAQRPPSVEPKPLPKEPGKVPWPGTTTAKPPATKPGDVKPQPKPVPADMRPTRTPEQAKTDTVPASRQPNDGRPEPVYVPPQPTTSPSPHKEGGYVPPQPQVKQQKGQAVSQTEEAAVIARERSPGRPYWAPRKTATGGEVSQAQALMKKGWKQGAIIFTGPRTFAGRRMFWGTKHGDKKAVEVWAPAPPFV